MDVGEEGEEQASPMMPAASHEGERAPAEREGATQPAEGAPTPVVSESAPSPKDDTEIPAVAPAAAATDADTRGDDTTAPALEEGGDEDAPRSRAGANAAGAVREEMVVTAPTAPGEPSSEQAVPQKQTNPAAGATEAAPGKNEGETNNPTTTSSEAPALEESASAGDGKGLRVSSSTPRRQQQHTQQNQPQKCRASAPAVTPASGAHSSNDAILSNRPKVRSVVFPRPHTHKPRIRPATRRARGNEADLPGPGQYDVGGGGGGGGGARGPFVAQTRFVCTFFAFKDYKGHTVGRIRPF